MSKKNRAQHSTPRRHGDRNVQTRYSGKHQCGDDPILNPVSITAPAAPAVAPAMRRTKPFAWMGLA